MTKLIVTIFLGWLGVHKFMEKKIGMGVLYLFTLGLFGIGWIVDIVIAIVHLSSSSRTQPATASPIEKSTYQKTSGRDYFDDEDDDYDYPKDDNRIAFSVAGVSFQNEDGTERQDILRNFYDNRGYSKRDIELRKYEFDGEDAIAVYAKGQMIGNVPREYISQIMEHFDTIRIYHFRVRMNQKGIYYSVIDLFLE